MPDDTTTLRAAARSLSIGALIGVLTLGVSAPVAAAQDDASRDDRRVRVQQNTNRLGGANQPARQTAGQPANAAQAVGADSGAAIEPQTGEMIRFDAFSEPMELGALIDFVAQTLGINVKIQGDPQGSVAFNAPVAVPRERLLDLLDSTLESYGYTITYDALAQFYTVQEATTIRPGSGGEIATTKIIRTPNVKPTALQPAVNAIMGWGASPPTTVAFVDELGVIVATLPVREIARVEESVRELLEARAEIVYHRIELSHIAAPAARERAIALSGGQDSNASRSSINRNNPNNAGNVATLVPGIAPTLTNLGDRLTVDAQGNALLYRGTGDELDEVLRIIEAIDVPSTLAPKRYFAGSSAATLADIASQRGLGEVITIEDSANDFNAFRADPNNAFGTGSQATGAGGPAMVVDVARGTIVYYGTASQQEQLAALLEEIGAEDERIVVRAYRLHHAQAETVAELLNAVITGQSVGGDSPLLPDSGGVRSAVAPELRPEILPDGSIALVGAGGDEVSGAFDPDLVIVVPDEGNNQIVVRAPIGQQDQLERLINRLDLRRPQVYIEAMIVSVSNTDNFRLAVETQILNGQWGFQSNFGLSSVGADGFQDQRVVNGGLTGGLFALVQSQSIPVIINALKTDTDARIVSRPSLLVNNNEEATLASVDEQPTTETSQGETTTTTSFAGFEQAGTNLTVTPTISEGGYLRLEYDVELSAFTGAATGDGIPAPRQTNNVSSSVTVPSDATIVVGGITVTNVSETIRRIPLLGHIPGVGHLFRDTSEVKTDSVVYIFITPRIMSDPNFYDLKLFSKGPQAEVSVDAGLPDLEPVTMRTSRSAPPARAPGDSPAGSEPRPAARPEDDPARRGAHARIERIPAEGTTQIQPSEADSAPRLEIVPLDDDG